MRVRRVKKLSPYWFIRESGPDLEYSYYILMGYLQFISSRLKTSGFESYFKDILELKRDLLYFYRYDKLSKKTLLNMTDNELSKFNKLLDDNIDNIDYIKDIVRNSIEAIDEFLVVNEIIHKRYNSLVSIESYLDKLDLWDQGFLVIRKNDEKFMRVFNWFFSLIKIGDKENIALLMTELLDPACPNTDEISDIKKFIKDNSNELDDIGCILVGNISNDIDIDMGVEICKEKSIEIIMKSFKDLI